MTCDERRDALLLYAADALEDSERAELAAHVASGCPRCAGFLAEGQALLGHLPLAVEPVDAPREVRDRLMARVARAQAELTGAGAESGARSAGEGTAAERFPTPRRAWPLPLTAALAAGVTLLAVGLPMYLQQQSLQTEQEVLLQRLEAQNEELSRVRLNLQQASTRLDVLTAPDLDIFQLAGTNASPGATGRIFWDQSRGSWHVYTSGLAAVDPGKTYQLWFITGDDRKVSAGVFDLNDTGQGTLEVQLPPDLGVVALAAITDEPAGGLPQPTGSILMTGKPPGA